jgi:hypothetical protein
MPFFIKRKKLDIMDAPLWPIARNTAWRKVTAVMIAAGIPEGRTVAPRDCGTGMPFSLVEECAAEYGFKVDVAFPDGDDGNLC